MGLDRLVSTPPPRKASGSEAATPVKRPVVPRLRLPTAAAEEPAPKKLSADAIAEFADFWSAGDNQVDDEPEIVTARIGTPRKGEVPLQIFSVRTPPPSPKTRLAQAAAEEKKKPFVPAWPWGPTWPFCVAPTTLELRGLPRWVTAEVLIAQLDSWGFAGRYNFVQVGCVGGYVPAGCAVVNGHRHADGRDMAGKLHDFSDWHGNKGGNGEWHKAKRKPCRVSWSFTCQGTDALMSQYQQEVLSRPADDQAMVSVPRMLTQAGWMPVLVHFVPQAHWMGHESCGQAAWGVTY